MALRCVRHQIPSEAEHDELPTGLLANNLVVFHNQTLIIALNLKKSTLPANSHMYSALKTPVPHAFSPRGTWGLHEAVLHNRFKMWKRKIWIFNSQPFLKLDLNLKVQPELPVTCMLEGEWKSLARHTFLQHNSFERIMIKKLTQIGNRHLESICKGEWSRSPLWWVTREMQEVRITQNRNNYHSNIMLLNGKLMFYSSDVCWM